MKLIGTSAKLLRGLWTKVRPTKVCIWQQLQIVDQLQYYQGPDKQYSLKLETKIIKTLSLKMIIYTKASKFRKQWYFVELVSKELNHFGGDCRFIPADWGSW